MLSAMQSRILIPFWAMSVHRGIILSVLATALQAGSSRAENDSPKPEEGRVGYAVDREPPIDPVLGRQLMQKYSRGETLTDSEQAYLERVKREIRGRAAGKRRDVPPLGAGSRPELTGTNNWSALVPITDMTLPYKGEDGGLYGGGKNELPTAHRAAYLKESANIRPLDTEGRPSQDERCSDKAGEKTRSKGSRI